MNRFNAKTELTCLAMHPNEDCIATGTISGKIILWYNYLTALLTHNDENNNSMSTSSTNNIKPTMSILHWHSLPVLSLCFTTEGSFLLSGGHECVLVKWMFKSGQKDFRPRLGAPINEITSSTDNTIVATRHSDNVIHLIGTNLGIIQTFSTFICPNFTSINKENKTFYPCGLNYFPSLNCLISNGKPGHLQFYSFNSDKLIFNLDIVDENYISPENLNRPNIHTEIECLALSDNGNWLATVERRDDLVNTPESKLKFWIFDSANNKFSLNTIVRYPHSFNKVNKIKFKKNENLLFTCGEDGCFKSWTLTENKPQASNETNKVTYNWRYNTCNGFRDLTPNQIDFMNDLIAVSFSHITTLWNYDAYEGVTFLNDLIHCDSNDTIKEIKFIQEDFLLCVHHNCLNVWRLKNDNKNNIDLKLLKTSSEPMNDITCVWSSLIDDVLEICENPLQKSQFILFVKSKSQHKNTNEQIPTQIKIATFQINELKNNQYKYNLNFVHTFSFHSISKIYFICLPKSDYNENSKRDIGSKLFDQINIFYCDNRGVINRVREKKTSNELDSSLSESLWTNRKALTKNLPQTNLSNILDMHKSNKYSANNLLFDKQNIINNNFEANFKKIESTPAYLLPKVSTFCYETLKSMLHNYQQDDTNISMNN